MGGLNRVSLACLAGLWLAAMAAAPAAAQGTVKSVHGDWQIRCDTPPGAQGEQCALIQSVTAEDRPNVGLTVIVLKTADQKSRLMRVLAPLGVLLPSGLGLKIDKTDVGRAGFVRCLPNGCVAEVQMNDDLLKQLRGGQAATFIIFQTPEEGIGIPMGLKGFGEGYDKLP
jgi:invasion protein IalB